MEDLRQYVISVTAAALICGIVSNFFEDSAGKPMIMMLCGLLLTVTAILPVRNMDLSEMIESVIPTASEADILINAGEKMAEEAIADIIKQKTRTYILDKGSAFDVSLSVEIELDENHIPAAATLRGAISPYAKVQLTEILENDLGIMKEHQTWIS